jgi:hypothetical protein
MTRGIAAKVYSVNKKRLREALEALDEVVTELKDALLIKESDETLNEISDLSRHAKALAKVGSSKGGIARAKALTPEQRRIIAKHAAMCRWAKPSEDVLSKEERESIERGLEQAKKGETSKIKFDEL